LILNALALALARGRPLRRERVRGDWWLVVEAEPPGGSPGDREPSIAALKSAIARPLTGVLTSASGVHFTETVRFAEAIRLRLEILDNQPWLVFEPRVWLSKLHSACTRPSRQTMNNPPGLA
jgi:hypothetical protein